MDTTNISIENLAHCLCNFFTYSADTPLMMGSIPFALLFILFLVVYAALRQQSKKAMMVFTVIFNLFFAYKINGWIMLLLPITAIINYFMIQKMKQYHDSMRKKWLTAVVLVDLALLGYFKYTNFFIQDVVNEILSTNFSIKSILLPVGISFYTFQAISYAVDVYRKKFCEEVSLLEYLFYLTFFPLILAGPITRASNLIPRLKRNMPITSRMLWLGLFLIMLGLVKKNIISDYIAQFNNWVFDAPDKFSGFENLAALLGYPVQIFLDFSGYSDMSIGVAAILGFYLPDNFNFPYRSMNLTEFWRRWHISLSFWFRDYVYIPLGGNRKGKIRMYINNFLTMLVAGLWHGASWMFVIWGGLHGIGLVIHKLYSRQLNLSNANYLGKILSWLITYIYVSFAWSFFRSANLSLLGKMYSQVWNTFSWDYLQPFWNVRTGWCLCLISIMLSYFVTEHQYKRLQLRFITLPWILKLIIFTICLQLVVEASQESVQPFIYQQF